MGGGNAVNERMLHLFAAVMLLFFSASHFGFLLISNPEGNSRNTVFPFLTDNHLYLFAAVFELFTALMIYVYRGNSVANIVILTFVGIILTYRWAFYFTDGKHCGCLGLLGRLLHISKNLEQLIPRIALLSLFVTTLPWICRTGCNFSAWLRSKAAILILILTPMLSSVEADTIVVHGEYNGAAYNPQTGELYNDKRKVQATFTVYLSGQFWKICSTNSNTGAVGELWYDGKDTYFRNTQVSYGQPPSNITFVSISSSPIFLPLDDDRHMSILWLAYAFSPNMVPKSGTLPIPWPGVRRNTSAFGYRWDVTPSTDGRFASQITFILDHKLILSNQEELLRPEFIYPMDTQELYNSAIRGVERKRLLPDGFVKGTYECTDWFETNSVLVPKKAQLTSNYSSLDDFNGKRLFIYPSTILNLRANSVEFSDADVDMTPPVTEETKVADFRYRKVESSRVYRGALYDLKAGDEWKTDHDSALLAEQADYLRHGPKINESGILIRYKNYLVWLLFAILIAVPATIILKKRKQNNQYQ